jgi:hypothetical protein
MWHGELLLGFGVDARKEVFGFFDLMAWGKTAAPWSAKLRNCLLEIEKRAQFRPGIWHKWSEQSRRVPDRFQQMV